MSQVEINEPNLWRLDSPGHAGWTRTARPGDPNPPPAMLTLTTCQPKGSASQRLAVQAVLNIGV